MPPASCSATSAATRPSGGELSSARGILVSVTGRAGVTRDMGEIQDLLDAIGVDVGGCEA